MLAAIGGTSSRLPSTLIGDRPTTRVITMDVVPTGSPTDAREKRVAAEEQQVEWLIDRIGKIPPSAPPQERAPLLGEVADAYLRRYPADPSVLEQALWYFRAALKVTSASDQVARLAILLRIVGCYVELRRLRRPVPAELLLPYLEEAERYVDREEDAVSWATTQEALATLVSERSSLTQADIEQSIAGHERALEVFTQESHPLQWAAIHNNLSLIHGKSLVADRSENIEISIAHSRQAVAGFHRILAPQQEALARVQPCLRLPGARPAVERNGDR